MPNESYEERIKRLKAERAVIRKKERRRDAAVKVLSYAAATVVALALVSAFVLLGGLVFMLLWNYGLVFVVEALGGSLGTLGFWHAVVANILWRVVVGAFRDPVTVKSA